MLTNLPLSIQNHSQSQKIWSKATHATLVGNQTHLNKEDDRTKNEQMLPKLETSLQHTLAIHLFKTTTFEQDTKKTGNQT
jgi:hypothetical protein